MEDSFVYRGCMGSVRSYSLPKVEQRISDFQSDDTSDRLSIGGTSSTGSFDRFCSDMMGEESIIGSPRNVSWQSTPLDDSRSTSVESSPLGWRRSKRERARLRKLHSLPKVLSRKDTHVWEDIKEIEEVHELEMMKERFSKLLLGEDMSGGGKGVCTALAISNAITNLSASVFGELWRLEPLAEGRKLRWCREMKLLLAVCDYIVEFVPSIQKLPDGATTEIMATRLRSDLQLNLPALQKLDSMLLELLESFNSTEFWYVDQGIVMAEKDAGKVLHRQEEKWWLPTPRVPSNGLCEDSRKHLQQQRECIHQIFKAALEINNQVLSEMEVPNVYWNALPKNGKTSLGERLHHIMTSENFSPEAFISSLDCSNEHNILELVNRVEATMHIWHIKLQMKQTRTFSKEDKTNSKDTLGHSKVSSGDLVRREVLAEKAESLLWLLRQKFPSLPQTILDVNKIQYNKDVGRAILESYSRVLEGLSFNILSRIDDVLHADNLANHALSYTALCRNHSITAIRPASVSSHHIASRKDGSPLMTSKISPIEAYSTEFDGPTPPVRSLPKKSLSDYITRKIKSLEIDAKEDCEIPNKFSVVSGLNKSWSRKH